MSFAIQNEAKPIEVAGLAADLWTRAKLMIIGSGWWFSTSHTMYRWIFKSGMKSVARNVNMVKYQTLQAQYSLM